MKIKTERAYKLLHMMMKSIERELSLLSLMDSEDRTDKEKIKMLHYSEMLERKAIDEKIHSLIRSKGE